MVLYYLELIKLQQEHKVFLSTFASFVAPVAEEITQFWDQVKIRLISQLINGILRVLQKLLKYFNGTTILASFTLPSVWAFPVILILDLNDLEFRIVVGG